MHAKQPEAAYQVLLYYCYTPIENPEQLRDDQYAFCARNGLLGRIIVAKEGLNGTLSGLKADCEAYIAYLAQDPRFATVDMKVDTHHAHAFSKISVRVRKEIVRADLPNIDPTQLTGKKLAPADFKKMKDAQDTVIIDVRSDYECTTGHFEGSVFADIQNFRSFRSQIEKLKAYKDKRVITVCTGNIKCEKASAYLLKNGFKNVYQLKGGIINYGLTTDGADFNGRCYVFDNRVSIPINHKNPKVITHCCHCHQPCERMHTCADAVCNRQTQLCVACATKLEGSCSVACQKSPNKRSYEGIACRPKQLNGYDPMQVVRLRKRSGTST
ncbi:MAG: rhodanese-related sulfurtransferase [Cytophagales bacterium]